MFNVFFFFFLRFVFGVFGGFLSNRESFLVNWWDIWLAVITSHFLRSRGKPCYAMPTFPIAGVSRLFISHNKQLLTRSTCSNGCDRHECIVHIIHHEIGVV